MKKKITLVLTSLLILTILLTTPYFTLPATAPNPSPEGVYHWKICLAQKNVAWTRIEGFLTQDGAPIPGTEFNLTCTGTPYGFVFAKVNTTVIPTDIHFDKWIEGVPEPPVDGDLTEPLPDSEEPHTWYQHIRSDPLEPPYNWAVVVEVREQPYDPERPYFEWQLTMKTHGVSAIWQGILTKDGEPLSGTDFYLESIIDPDLQCQVVRTDYCTVPNDIHYTLIVDGEPIIIEIDEKVTQFPWTRTEVVGPGQNVTLELTEVQMYRYIVMGGTTTSDGQLGIFDPWFVDTPYPPGPVPFASRPPNLTPMLMGQNITFTQRDPITGIVKLGVPAKSYGGLNHTYYTGRVGTYMMVQVFLETQGCGWLFTGIGKDPIFGDVDVITFNNNTGVYVFGPDGLAGTADDVLLSGKTSNPLLGEPGHTNATHAAGAGPPIGPCLQQLSGPDGIPGTEDDPIGDGTPDPPGSSILYLPSKMKVLQWKAAQWAPLFASPWPQLLTTGRTYDKVIEPASYINGVEANRTGEPWEFFAGLDHPEYGLVPWKHKYSNAYVSYATVWSVMDVDTYLGWLDVHFMIVEKKMREDCVLPDIKGDDEEVKIFDVRKAAKAYDTYDESFGNPEADALFDAAADVKDCKHVTPAGRGHVDIFDIRRIAKDYGKKLTPNGIIKP